jgi:hypothetical protein
MLLDTEFDKESDQLPHIHRYGRADDLGPGGGGWQMVTPYIADQLKIQALQVT